ncbi:hypothetical protein MYAM1_002886 [Malassezia yamatoensis]|uniref:Endoplasmic reticulum junction formation protein lunapark n=1 Tax=Malassezia yamatoensis TaxID=253288 RepID=A0AAJ6CHR0_9BASI|nr:hypothetical protein MYAM1_002886 [Malassezia yamatoensis]
MLGKSWLTWWPKAWNPFARRTVPSAYDYDAILESLSEEVEAVEMTLMDIKARRRRVVSSVLRVIFTAWILIILLLWGYSTLMHSTYDKKWEWYHSFYLVGLVLGTPAMLVLLHHVITLWFRRLEKAQESHLQALRVQRRQKINEIKKATDFEHLRSLLERYDDDEPPSTEQPGHAPNQTHQRSESNASITGGIRGKASFRSLRGQISKESLRPQTQHTNDSRSTRADDSKKVAAPAITGMPVMGVQKALAPRGWMDKVADLILGTDPYNASPEDHQYALICRNCFRHNGLVPKDEMNEIRTLRI